MNPDPTGPPYGTPSSTETVPPTEESFRHLFESLNQGVVYQSADGRIIAANPAAERILGMTLGQLQGRTSLDPRWRALREDGTEWPGAEHPAMQALATGRPVLGAVMAIFHLTSNEYRWIRVDAVPEFRPGEDRPFRAFTTFADITQQRRAEEALRDSEARYRGLVDQSVDMVFRLDRQGRFTFVSASVTRAVGYSAGELVGQLFTQVLAEDSVPLAESRLRQRLQGDFGLDPVTQEYALRRKDGSQFVAEVRSLPILDPQGQVAELQGTARDVTDRRQAERALRESEQRFHSLFFNMAEGVALHETVYDAEGRPANYRLLDVNPRYEAIVGLRRSEIRGRLATEVYRSESAPFLQEFTSVGETGRRSHLEVYFAPMAKHFAVSVAPLGPGRWATIFSDITERKQAEAQLRFQAMLLDQIGDTVTATDLEGRITFVNEVQCRAVQRSREELLGAATDVYGDDPARGATQRQIVEATLAHGAWRGEVVNRDASGREFIIECRTTLIRDAAGQPVGMCGVGVDVTERKRTEEVLRSRESLLNNVLHSTADGILVIGDQGEVLIANRRFQELWQLPDALMAKGRDADLLAHVVHQLADPDDFLAEVHRLYQTDEEHWSQIAFEDGRVFERYSRPVPLAGHRARLWSFRDVTAGKRAERLQRAVSLISNAALTTSNLDELFRSIHDTIGELMPARNFFIALREPTTGLIRFPYYTDEHDQDASPIPPGRGLTGYVLRTGKPLLATRERYEELVGCGEVDRIGAPPVDWLGVPLKTQHGETIGVMAVQTYTETIRLGAADRDMLEFVSTQVAMAIERKRSEEFLRRSQTDLERAQAAGHVGSWISSLQPGGPLSWSTETLQIFGIPEGEFDGRGETFFRLVHPEDIAAVRAASEGARRGDRLYDLEHRIVRPDGAIRWVHERAEVERDALGRPVRMVGVVQDITERRHLEERLRQAQKMEAVGQLAGGVAHDFNNILTATLLQLNLLQENPNLDLEAREALRELERGAQRAADLTRQLLLFGRRSAMQFQPLDLNDLLTDLQKMLRRLLGEHILLEFVSESGLPRISADASMIQQVVVNLCVNARDAMPAGGRLRVRTAGVDLDADQVQDRPGARPGLFVCLSVADTGAGMDDATLQHIFEPFFTTKEVGKGTGLGLATVHGIIQQHEGWLEVQSAVDQGTTFRVFLPAYVAPAATASAVVPQPEVVGGHETVLLVEDDTAVRTMIAMFLRRWGYKVLEATTGQEAMSLWQQEGATIDLLYTDVVMPGGLSGTQLTEQLRAQKPNLKVILSSGYSADLAQKDPGLAPNVVFVPKPCSAADLALTVRRCLDRTPH